MNGDAFLLRKGKNNLIKDTGGIIKIGKKYYMNTPIKILVTSWKIGGICDPH